MACASLFSQRQASMPSIASTFAHHWVIILPSIKIAAINKALSFDYNAARLHLDLSCTSYRRLQHLDHRQAHVGHGHHVVEVEGRVYY